MISSLDILAEAAALYSAPLIDDSNNELVDSNDSKLWADAPKKRASIRELINSNLQISGYSSDHSSGYSSTNNEIFSPTYNSQEESRFPDSSPSVNGLNLFSFNQNPINLSIKNSEEKAENKSESTNSNNLCIQKDEITCQIQITPSTRPKRQIKPSIKAIEAIECKNDMDIEKLLQSTSIITTSDENIKIKIKDTSFTIRGMRERRQSKKIPDELKDEEYILKRKKNNIAAKKSRENKNSLIKASYKICEIKEKENLKLKKELDEQIGLVSMVLNNLDKDSEMKKSALEIIKDKNLKFYEKLLNLN